MVDEREASEDLRLQVELLRRDVGCLMEEMHQVKTALFKHKDFPSESPGDKKVYAQFRGAKQEGSLEAPPVTAHVQELRTAALQSQFPGYSLGASLQDDGDEGGEKKEGAREHHDSHVSCAVEDEASNFRRGSVDSRVDNHPRQRLNEGKTADADELRVADYLQGSVYVWACGEKLDPLDEDVTASEVVIGWTTILVQASAYVVLIMGAKPSDEDTSYSIFSVSLAMFLVISISSSDIRASHALLSKGRSWGQCLFGAVLMGCIGLLLIASIRVLFMVGENNAGLVIGAAAVLFIEDVDDKLATCLSSVSKKWRLFWMLEILGASFWMAIVGVFEFGNSTAVLDRDLQENGYRVGYPWLCILAWVLTIWALFLNHAINHKPGAFRALQPIRAASVLPITSESVPRDSAQQKERKNFQEVLAKGFCVIISLVFSLIHYFAAQDMFSLLSYKLLVEGIYSAAVFPFFLAGALRATLDWCGSSRVTPGPPQFTWYRLFVGWGLGTCLYLVVVLPILRESAMAMFFVFVYFFLMLGLDLLLIVEPTFFGNRGGRCIRVLQRFLMAKNGCIYWAVYFHILYSATRWTMSLWSRLMSAFHP